jgi:hypothetical protein
MRKTLLLMFVLGLAIIWSAAKGSPVYWLGVILVSVPTAVLAVVAITFTVFICAVGIVLLSTIFKWAFEDARLKT